MYVSVAAINKALLFQNIFVISLQPIIVNFILPRPRLDDFSFFFLSNREQKGPILFLQKNLSIKLMNS